MKTILSILMIITLSGCSRDLTNRPPFNQYVDRDLTTLRPTVLYETETWITELDSWIKPPYTHLAITETNRSYLYRESFICDIPSNTLVRINKVTLFIGDGSTTVQALGILKPEGSEEREIVFRWGGSGKLYRAPWEPASVPETRYFNHLFKKQIEQIK